MTSVRHHVLVPAVAANSSANALHFVDVQLERHVRMLAIHGDYYRDHHRELSVAQQIAHLTAAFTLEPGDVIFTGTPAGVGASFDPPKWLKAGDKVRVEITQLGYIEHEIVAEQKRTVLQ